MPICGLEPDRYWTKKQIVAGSATHAFAPRLGTDVLAFYWSLIVMMGNESYPIKPEDQVFSTCVILVGMLVNSVVIGSVAFYASAFGHWNISLALGQNPCQAS